jgi:hypothetical protein
MVEAKFNVPPEMFMVDKFEDAKQTAANRNKPILFLYSEKDSKNSETGTVSQEIISMFRQCTVMVYVEANTDMKPLPNNVRKAISGAGNIYPIAVIFDSKLKEVLFSLSYEANDLRRKKVLREAQRKIGG